MSKMCASLSCSLSWDILSEIVLSYDVTVTQWIMSCHKYCYDHMLHNTFCRNKCHDGVCYKNANFDGNKQTLQAIKSHIKGHMINRILHK